jgi:acetoin utilization protein AcuB
MNRYKIRHIPIVNPEDMVVGIVSDRDLKAASPSLFMKEDNDPIFAKPLKDIMTKQVITAHPLDFVEEVSVIFYENRIGCIPIVTGGRLVGLLSESDVLHTFVQLTGANLPGSQIEVKVPNVAGMLAEVSAVFRNINIASVLIYPDQDERYKILVFRIQTMNPINVISDLKKAGYEVILPNIKGHADER